MIAWKGFWTSTRVTGDLRHHTAITMNGVIMGTIASQITSLTIVYSTVYLDADQRKHQSSTSLAFVRGIHREPVNSPHKWPVTRKMLPFDDVIMAQVGLTLDLLLQNDDDEYYDDRHTKQGHDYSDGDHPSRGIIIIIIIIVHGLPTKYKESKTSRSRRDPCR